MIQSYPGHAPRPIVFSTPKENGPPQRNPSLELDKIYDELYRTYDFVASPFGYAIPYITWRKKKINEAIVPHILKGKVLDDGGGYGFLKEFLDEPLHEYYNLDYSHEMLKYDKSTRRVLGQGEALPFRDGVFDTVVSGDVLEHTRDKIAYLEETYRVLRRGGIFILNTPRVGWRKSYMQSVWFWIPLLSDLHSRIKAKAKRKMSRTEANSPGVPDEPSDEDWLKTRLERIGYEIISQSRTDNHLFVFTHVFWRRFADTFIDSTTYGHCALFVCRKV